MSSHEYFARRAKVAALVRAIAFLDQPPSADDVAEWALETHGRVWENLAAAATELEGKTVHPPHSGETIDAIVAELREMGERRSA